jgi:acetate kinase
VGAPETVSDSLVLALNRGSSSLKAALRDPELILRFDVDRMGTPRGRLRLVAGSRRDEIPLFGGIAPALRAIATELTRQGCQPAVVAHRVVHGGPHHHRPTVIDEALLTDLRAAIPLAPLHLPDDLESIAVARRTWPDACHVACFDTGFHHDLPEWSRRLPVAEELERAGVRRYGFHGLSIESVLHACPVLGNTVIAHLGSGCSVTAVGCDGRPRHTTMSLTPTGGMLSATRTGDLDPGVLLYLIEEHGYTVTRLRELMDRHSGLAGLAGGRHDVRDLVGASDAAAAFALEVFVRGAAAAIAACATSLDSWESLVFTGGIGEHAGVLRDAIGARLSGSSGLRILVVPADEESVLDRLARRLVAASGKPAQQGIRNGCDVRDSKQDVADGGTHRP